MSTDLVSALQILAFGWGGVFLVMLIIYAVSLLLTKLLPPKDGE